RSEGPSSAHPLPQLCTDPAVTMAAEGLPAGELAGTLPSWELEAWYQDLQEVLAAADSSRPSPPWQAEQGAGSGPEHCELDAALAAELLELLGPESSAGTEPAGLPGSASSRSSPSQRATEAAARRGVKRKRCSVRVASTELAKCRERANEQRVLELTAHNEQLRKEIQQLSAEVERTRTALIDRIVNLHQV
ncbi:DDIT3 protein, partial [Rhynochetos jubatus]|nr:DDIT3 protein [Rhynochetos jubatus]